MSNWQRWLVLGFASACLCGCGGEEKKAEPAAQPAPVAPAPMRPAAPPPSAAPAAPPGGAFVELLQFLPENLKMAVGANFGALSDKANPAGPRMLTQFQPATAALSRAAIQADQIELLWTGSNRETGDLIICVRTKGSYDSAAATKGLGAAGASEKVGKATVHHLADHGALKNAVAFVDPRTLLLGRSSTIAAALGNPKPGPVRFGFDAIETPDAFYWIAGDESIARTWMGGAGGGAVPLDAMFGEAVQIRGMGVGFGGAAQAGPGAPAGGNRFTARRGGDDDDLPPQAARGNRPPGFPGIADGPNVEMALGMSFPTEAIATSIEKKFNLMFTPGGPPGASGPNPGPNRPRTGTGGEFQFQGRGFGARNRDEDRPAAASPGSGSTPGQPDAAALAALGLKLQRAQENLRIGLSIPAAGIPFVARFINEGITASGSTALSDGIFEGALPQLAAGLKEWPAAHSETLHGVRRAEGMPLMAGYSWMTDLLPFVGQADLHAQFDFSRNWFEPQNWPSTMRVVPAFLNPADPRATWEGAPAQFTGMALTHFVGMSGIEDDRGMAAAELPRSDPRAGIFGYDEIAKPGAVTDGTSQTILMIGSGEVAAPWVQGGGATIRGARAPYFRKYGGFGSRGLAPPGAFVLFADGSARTISADIDPEVFKALCTMHGSEQIDMSKVGASAAE